MRLYEINIIPTITCGLDRNSIYPIKAQADTAHPKKLVAPTTLLSRSVDPLSLCDKDGSLCDKDPSLTKRRFSKSNSGR